MTSDKRPAATETHPGPAFRVPGHRSAFTLIEIMIVVAIIGLIAAMGVPSILQTFRKEGMRKAVSDVEDVCAEARERAIIYNTRTAVVFHPNGPDRSFAVEGGKAVQGSAYVSSSELPAGVEIVMLDINVQDYAESSEARVFFYPNGTSDEMKLVLHSSDQWREITLEFATGVATASDVDR